MRLILLSAAALLVLVIGDVSASGEQSPDNTPPQQPNSINSSRRRNAVGSKDKPLWVSASEKSKSSGGTVEKNDEIQLGSSSRLKTIEKVSGKEKEDKSPGDVSMSSPPPRPLNPAPSSPIPNSIVHRPLPPLPGEPSSLTNNDGAPFESGTGNSFRRKRVFNVSEKDLKDFKDVVREDKRPVGEKTKAPKQGSGTSSTSPGTTHFGSGSVTTTTTTSSSKPYVVNKAGAPRGSDIIIPKDFDLVGFAKTVIAFVEENARKDTNIYRSSATGSAKYEKQLVNAYYLIQKSASLGMSNGGASEKSKKKTAKSKKSEKEVEFTPDETMPSLNDIFRDVVKSGQYSAFCAGFKLVFVDAKLLTLQELQALFDPTVMEALQKIDEDKKEKTEKDGNLNTDDLMFTKTVVENFLKEWSKTPGSEGNYQAFRLVLKHFMKLSAWFEDPRLTRNMNFMVQSIMFNPTNSADKYKAKAVFQFAKSLVAYYSELFPEDKAEIKKDVALWKASSASSGGSTTTTSTSTSPGKD